MARENYSSTLNPTVESTFDPDKMADLFASAEQGKQPSNATKARLTQLIEQNVTESGKLFRSLCQRSGSREVGE